MGGGGYRFQTAITGGAAAGNAAHRVAVELSAGALRVTRRGRASWQLGLRWTGLGRGAHVGPAPEAAGEARVDGERASWARGGGSEEWYVNGPSGVEQGLT